MAQWHRTNLRDLAQATKVVPGHIFIWNDLHQIKDRWARSSSGRVNPDLSKNVLTDSDYTKLHLSFAVSLKWRKIQYQYPRSCFIKVFLIPTNFSVETMSFITLLHGPACRGQVDKENYINHCNQHLWHFQICPFVHQGGARAAQTGHCRQEAVIILMF